MSFGIGSENTNPHGVVCFQTINTRLHIGSQLIIYSVTGIRTIKSD
jgi:hypothetical protein